MTRRLAGVPVRTAEQAVAAITYDREGGPMTPKQARELWASALESGEYEQGRDRLTTVTDEGEKDCCLGVACKLAVRHGIIAAYERADADLSAYREVMDWLGLRFSDGSYKVPGGNWSLATENDGGKSFEHIAALIRSEPEDLVVA